MKLAQKLYRLEKLSGTNSKQSFIKENSNDVVFIEILKLLIAYKTGVKKLSYEPPVRYMDFSGEDKGQEFLELLTKVINTPKSKELEQDIIEFFDTLEEDLQLNVFYRIITQQFKIGVQVKNFNKALGYEAIPEIKLMKATPYKPELVEFPIAIEEKYDGVRIMFLCNKGNIRAFTYNGSEVFFHTLQTKMEKFIQALGLTNSEIIIDTEVFDPENRPRVSGLIRKMMFVTEDETLDKDLHIAIFDYIPKNAYDIGKFDLAYTERRKVLLNWGVNTTLNNLLIAPSMTVKNDEELFKQFNRMREYLKEGLMLKTLNGIYEKGRKKHWIKLKSIYSTTMKIIGWEKGEQGHSRENGVGKFICTTRDGFEVKVGSGLTDDIIFHPEPNRFIGKLIEVIFTDVNYDSSGKTLFLDFPRFKEFRLDKEEADELKDVLKEIPKYKGKV